LSIDRTPVRPFRHNEYPPWYIRTNRIVLETLSQPCSRLFQERLQYNYIQYIIESKRLTRVDTNVLFQQPSHTMLLLSLWWVDCSYLAGSSSTTNKSKNIIKGPS
jgi:hypothetical protein